MDSKAAQQNATDAVNALLRYSNVRVTLKTLKEKLWKHPEFPSLASLSEVLEELNVPNLATRLQLEQLQGIPVPALVYLEIEGGIFGVVKEVGVDSIEWLHFKKGWQKQDLRNFDKIWSGVALLIDPTPQSGEINYLKRRKEEWIENIRFPFAITGLVLCYTVFLIYSFRRSFLIQENSIYILLNIKLLGAIISSFLVAYGLNSESTFLNKICHLNNHTNCDSILNSKSAKIFNWISWSEIGLIYFFGGFITIIFSILLHSVAAMTILAFLSILAIPYTIYSIYYQAFTAKEFCPLCVSVQIIIWIESLTGWKLLNTSNFTLEGIELVLFSFGLSCFCWILIRKMVGHSYLLEALQGELYKLKFNPENIKISFRQQSIMPPVFDEMEVVKLGNLDAKHTLTLVTNPLCRPCSRAHEEIRKLIETTNDINCVIIFTLPDLLALKVATFVMSLPVDRQAEALHKWFQREDKNIEKWHKSMQNIKVIRNSNESEQQLMLHQRWCDLGQISSTPAIYLNNIKLPTLYRINDVTYLTKTLSMHEEISSI